MNISLMVLVQVQEPSPSRWTDCLQKLSDTSMEKYQFSQVPGNICFSSKVDRFYLKVGDACHLSLPIEYALSDAGKWVDEKKQPRGELRYLFYQAKHMDFQQAKGVHQPVLQNPCGTSMRVILVGVGNSPVILKADCSQYQSVINRQISTKMVSVSAKLAMQATV